MQAVNDEIETFHLYVVREEEKKPFVFLPLFFAFLCLISIAAVTVYSWQHPTYEHETLILPAHFFTRTFAATASIIPTGSKTYPATQAHGILTFYNGSVITQTIPQGMIVTSTTGVQVVVQDTV